MSIPARFTDRSSDVRGIRVLFLEDDHGLRQALTDFLRLNAMLVTDVASVAALGKALVGKEFDVALLDIGLPDGNGFDAVRQLRAQTSFGIIVLTARAGRDDRLKGYEEGADLYLTKPVDGAELVLAIRNLATRLKGPGQPAPRLAMQPWRLDVARHQLISPSNVVLRLSGRENKLLLRLSKERGDVVSRDELAVAVGYEELSADSRSVDALLRRLRTKARTAQIELPIHAVHARGFRFAAQLDAC